MLISLEALFAIVININHIYFCILQWNKNVCMGNGLCSMFNNMYDFSVNDGWAGESGILHHDSDVILGAMASQITSLMIVY